VFYYWNGKERNRTGGSELRRLSRADGSERLKTCWGQVFTTQDNEASLQAGEATFPHSR